MKKNRGMSVDGVGRNAGVVWNFLSATGDHVVPLSTIKKTAGLRADDALTALGWLAREGKITFENGTRATRVRLVEEEVA